MPIIGYHLPDTGKSLCLKCYVEYKDEGKHGDDDNAVPLQTGDHEEGAPCANCEQPLGHTEGD